ncbi:carboxymuconolactone decarboxylase family protein [Mycolicibacterium sp. BiH015]|uniref:carboxymuconolactone decarboxylase family protein n=1 Tax=Mycolicibacterium sp. BiH015 TaxID=3018808 RepID=UPI0022E778BA|nr:carboxymuconolactone decarboxylase family protein [Mycolicibacterium sp. BiH015]MDA2893713.1 carboxymuconolactone decarboxylase family protein [Mycolicibacterium sp. BiH015]
MPRLDPLPAERWDDAACDALSPLLPPERANPCDAGNVLGTLVHHPELARAYLTFNAHLLVASTLSARVREVALLRAVQVRPCGYLWDHHIPIARRAGLTAAEIDAIRAGDPPDGLDALVVRAVDELNESNTLGERTWSALRDHFDERQLMDLIFTIGCYQLLGAAVNVLGIQPEEP